MPTSGPGDPTAQTYILDGIWGLHFRWERLRKRITESISPCQIWRYNNSGLIPLETLGADLAAQLRSTPGPAHLIGYSMGGLVVREALRQAPGLEVGRVVLLHAPHRGSFSSHLLPLPACRDMRPGSPFLKRLDDSPWNHPTLVSWCPWDLMVLPGTSACWSKASRAVRMQVPAHNWPVFSRSLHGTIVEFLQEKDHTQKVLA